MTRTAQMLMAASLLVPSLTSVHASELPTITAHHAFKLTRIAGPLEHPWGLDWLPDGRILVSERPGRLRIVTRDGTLSAPIAGLPEISSEFRDGLLDVTVDPEFANNRKIYFTHTGFENGLRWQKVSSATLSDTGLSDVTTIFQSGEKVEKDQGFGARIRFSHDGALLVSVGDHATPAEAQDPSNVLGSVVRLMRNGAAATDNPFVEDPAKKAEILAYGFKNPQGLAVHPATGAIWVTDHGPRGGGEINRLRPSGNYGWPVRTFGERGDAPGAPQLDSKELIDPAFTWGVSPTISPSGLSFYTGAEFPAWKDDLFVGSLSAEALIRLALDAEGHITGTERVIDGEIGRIRDVRQGPDGKLYVLNDDEEGAVYRLDPVN